MVVVTAMVMADTAGGIAGGILYPVLCGPAISDSLDCGYQILWP